MPVVHPTPTPLTANEHLFARSYMKAVRFQRGGSVWGTGGPAFKSRRSDHLFNSLAVSHPQRPAPVVPAVVHARPYSVAGTSRLDPMQFDPAPATGAGVRSNACVRALPPQAPAAKGIDL